MVRRTARSSHPSPLPSPLPRHRICGHVPAALTSAAARAARRYAHEGTLVLLITAGVDGVKGLGYWDKGCAQGGGGGTRVRTRAAHATGPHRPAHLEAPLARARRRWTSFEFALAMMIKVANSSVFWNDWALVHDLGKEGEAAAGPSVGTTVDFRAGALDAQTDFERPPLSEPLAFFGGHAHGAKTYTNGADRDQIVAPKFRDTTFELLGGVKKLNFNKLKWGDAGVQALAVVLPLCAQLTKLELTGNAFGVAGLSAIAEACVEGGALANVKVRSRFSPQDPVCATRHTHTHGQMLRACALAHVGRVCVL